MIQYSTVTWFFVLIILCTIQCRLPDLGFLSSPSIDELLDDRFTPSRNLLESSGDNTEPVAPTLGDGSPELMPESRYRPLDVDISSVNSSLSCVSLWCEVRCFLYFADGGRGGRRPELDSRLSLLLAKSSSLQIPDKNIKVNIYTTSKLPACNDTHHHTIN